MLHGYLIPGYVTVDLCMVPTTAGIEIAWPMEDVITKWYVAKKFLVHEDWQGVVHERALRFIISLCITLSDSLQELAISVTLDQGDLKILPDFTVRNG